MCMVSFLKIGHRCAWIWKLSIVLWTFDIFLTFSSGVNIWCRGRRILNHWLNIKDMHINYAEERLIYELKWKGLRSSSQCVVFLQTTGKCFYITEKKSLKLIWLITLSYFWKKTKYLDFNGSFHTDVAGGNSSALAFWLRDQGSFGNNPILNDYR